MSKQKKKACHVGAPAIFELEMALKPINKAFGGFGIYLVGSCLDRPDWRDVDLRMILSDEEFAHLFPDVGESHWEFDDRWLIMTISISQYLTKVTGLPIDFQFQPQTHANERHKGDRQSMGWTIVKPQPPEDAI